MNKSTALQPTTKTGLAKLAGSEKDFGDVVDEKLQSWLQAKPAISD
jgi:hypothetical protein